ncbi:hypothetical protein ASZ90_010690 [hydrocarbon metagenome]|uniref:Uncharacterized protein n=1 Tax=hydrocarbon metagenome TaxID=938273 RepID=A0A0W8FFE2_9ZZZZ
MYWRSSEKSSEKCADNYQRRKNIEKAFRIMVNRNENAGVARFLLWITYIRVRTCFWYPHCHISWLLGRGKQIARSIASSPIFWLCMVIVAVFALNYISVYAGVYREALNATTMADPAIAQDTVSSTQPVLAEIVILSLFIWLGSLSLLQALELFGTAILFFLVGLFMYFAVMVAPNKIVIDEFRDYRPDNPGSTKEDAIAKDLNDRLVAELGRICSLSRAISDSKPVTSGIAKDLPKPPLIAIEDISKIEQASETKVQAIEFGKVKIPLDLLREVASRLARGTRIFGVLYEEDGRMNLIVHRIGAMEPVCWKVTAPDRHENQKQPAVPVLDGMIEELAYRMFTEMAVQESVDWKAVRSFNQGLWEYLQSQTNPKYRIAGLKNAEEKYIEALSEDGEYARAHYNLGVIYFEQAKHEREKRRAAEKEFLLSIDCDPTDPRPHYALARNYFDESCHLLSKVEIGEKKCDCDNDRRQIIQIIEKYNRVIRSCEASLTLQPYYPEAHELKGYAYRMKRYLQDLCPGTDAGTLIPPEYSTDADDLDRAIESRFTAVQQAWTLLGKNLRGEIPEEKPMMYHQSLAASKDLTYKCSNNLAATLYDKSIATRRSLDAFEAKNGKSKRDPDRWIGAQLLKLTLRVLSQVQCGLYNQCNFLNPSRKNHHLGRGSVLLMDCRPEKALESFNKALSLDYTNPTSWIHIALVYDRLASNNKPGAEKYRKRRNQALKHLLKYIEADRPFYVYRLLEEYRLLGKHGKQMDYKSTVEFVRISLDLLQRLKPFEGQERPDFDGLEEVKKEFGDNDTVMRYWIDGELARVRGLLHLRAHQPDEARKEFNISIEQFKDLPERIRTYSLHSLVALACIQQKDFQEALAASNRALQLNINDYYAHLGRGQSLFGLSDLDQSVKEYTMALQCDPCKPEAYYHLGRVALRQADTACACSEKTAYLRRASRHLHDALALCEVKDRDKAVCCYQLGKIYLMTESYDRALSFFEMAGSFKIAPIKVAYHLGEVYRRMNLYGKSLEQTEEAIEMLKNAGARSGATNPAWNLKVEEIVGDDASAGEILANCYLRKARITASMGGDLEEARRHLDSAVDVMSRIFDATKRKELEAECRCIEGWLHLKEKDYQKAARTLERTQVWKPNLLNYWYLASTYNELLKSEVSPDLKVDLRSRIRECCRNVKEIDITGRYSEKADRLLSDIYASPSAETKRAG